MRRNLVVYGLIVGLMTLIYFAIRECANPLRRHVSVIRAELLKKTPLGSRLETVREFIVNNELEPDAWVRIGEVLPAINARATLGRYTGLPFEVSVQAIWL